MQKLGAGLFVSSVVLTGLLTGCGGVERARQDAGRDTGGSDTFVPPSDSSIDSIVTNDSAPAEGGADTAVQDSGSDGNALQDTAVDNGGGGLTTYYADCDSDGFAAAGAATTQSAGLPVGSPSCGGLSGVWITLAPTSASNTDCYDNDNRARPNLPANMYFMTTVTGTNSYDFNCDGMQTLQPASICSSTPQAFCTQLGNNNACSSGARLQPCWTSLPSSCGAAGTLQSEVTCTSQGGCFVSTGGNTSSAQLGCR